MDCKQYEHKWEDPKLREKILEQAVSLCKAKNVRLLYLVFFGSALYGTDTPNSDIDVKGIYVPDLDSLIIGEAPRSIHEATGNSSRKNSPDDVDINLWSLSYWILDLLKKGDTGAVDLLFSYTNDACVLYKDRDMDWIFQNADRLINTTLADAATKYALHQAKKYGIKGSRLGMFRNLQKCLQNCDEEGRLREIIPELAAEFLNDQFFRHGDGFIITGGKTHMDSIRIGEFKKRIDLEVAKYGNRAEEALQNSGVDFKALSHALRATGQIEELFRTGKIIYPLAFRDQLLEVKAGKIPWTAVERMILAAIQNLDGLKGKALAWDERFAKDCVIRIGKGMPPADYAIQKLLDEVEKTENVKILLAVESGSRSWGMESDDSDYDVRFIYIHTVDWYLDSSVKRRKDTINFLDRHTDAGLIDAEGWDITKALPLFVKSNPSVIEWISSPSIYRASQPFMDLMLSNLPYAKRSMALYHHYWKMGKNSWRQFQGSGVLKNLCYAMRGMLMALYVKHSRNFSETLPMDVKTLQTRAISYLPDTMEGKETLLVDIEATINLKRRSEKETGEAAQSILAFMEYMLRENHPDELSLKADSAIERVEIELTRIFRTLLEYAWEKPDM